MACLIVATLPSSVRECSLLIPFNGNDVLAVSPADGAITWAHGGANAGDELARLPCSFVPGYATAAQLRGNADRNVLVLAAGKAWCARVVAPDRIEVVGHREMALPSGVRCDGHLLVDGERLIYVGGTVADAPDADAAPHTGVYTWNRRLYCWGQSPDLFYGVGRSTAAVAIDRLDGETTIMCAFGDNIRVLELTSTATPAVTTAADAPWPVAHLCASDPSRALAVSFTGKLAEYTINHNSWLVIPCFNVPADVAGVVPTDSGPLLSAYGVLLRVPTSCAGLEAKVASLTSARPFAGAPTLEIDAWAAEVSKATDHLKHTFEAHRLWLYARCDAKTLKLQQRCDARVEPITAAIKQLSDLRAAAVRITDGEASAPVCPITLGPMKDPVFTTTGHTYERAAIERSLADTGGQCPLTRQSDVRIVAPNFALVEALAARPAKRARLSE